MKIAVTSNDGQTVNEHFGKAQTFYVYKYYEDGIKFLEERKVDQYCEGDAYSDTPDNHAFEKSRFDNVFKAIEDVDMVYTQKIGDTPKGKLAEKGIKVQLCGCAISEIPKCGGKCKH